MKSSTSAPRCTCGECTLSSAHLIPQVELLQAGPRGDLVLGGAEVPVGELVGNGTLLHWLELVNSAGQLGAELFVVLRHSTGGLGSCRHEMHLSV